MTPTARYPEYQTISEACKGNTQKIEEILTHYESYILTSSSRPLCDENSNTYIAVDLELKGLIRRELLKAILNFKIQIM